MSHRPAFTPSPKQSSPFGKFVVIAFSQKASHEVQALPLQLIGTLLQLPVTPGSLKASGHQVALAESAQMGKLLAPPNVASQAKVAFWQASAKGMHGVCGGGGGGPEVGGPAGQEPT